MKNIIKIVALVALMVTSVASYAQIKMGHVNSQDIFYSMPEVKTVQSQLQSKSAEYENQLNIMYSQYEALVADIQTNGKTWMQAVLEAKYNELAALEEKIVAKQTSAEEEIIAYEAQLLKPVEQKAINAIQQVAAAYGYTYVFDSSLGVFLVAPDVDDLTARVKTQLGIF